MKTQTIEKPVTTIPDGISLTGIEITQEDIDKAYYECNHNNGGNANHCVISQTIKRIFNPKSVTTGVGSSFVNFEGKSYWIQYKNAFDYIRKFDNTVLFPQMYHKVKPTTIEISQIDQY
jgi:hypothetical protein